MNGLIPRRRHGLGWVSHAGVVAVIARAASAFAQPSPDAGAPAPRPDPPPLATPWPEPEPPPPLPAPPPPSDPSPPPPPEPAQPPLPAVPAIPVTPPPDPSRLAPTPRPAQPAEPGYPRELPRRPLALPGGMAVVSAEISFADYPYFVDKDPVNLSAGAAGALGRFQVGAGASFRLRGTNDAMDPKRLASVGGHARVAFGRDLIATVSGSYSWPGTDLHGYAVVGLVNGKIHLSDAAALVVGVGAGYNRISDLDPPATLLAALGFGQLQVAPSSRLSLGFAATANGFIRGTQARTYSVVIYELSGVFTLTPKLDIGCSLTAYPDDEDSAFAAFAVHVERRLP